jgi:hypothetical protein
VLCLEVTRKEKEKAHIDEIKNVVKKRKENEALVIASSSILFLRQG